MKCFYYFKDKSRRQEQKSAPCSKSSCKSDNSAAAKCSARSLGSARSTISSPRSVTDLYEEKAHNLRVFSFSELRNATNDFSRLLKIGEGGFGSVYKGFIKPPGGQGNQIVVAVKKLNKDGLQGHKEWVSEVQFLGIVEHPNLVKLVGYCALDGERGIQRLLVYEFVPNRSLENHLFNTSLPVLPWHLRLNIALGAAQGLAYLHEELEVQVIFRDFKASNVLLDDEFMPKLSDFGLAREGPSDGRTHVTTEVMGTQGYAAPDYIETGHLTSKSDVWSFGVVLYEMLTGRRSLERNRPKTEQKLLDWVKQFPVDNRRKFRMLMDPRLENQYSLASARIVARLADSCLSKQSKDRPMMSKVVEVLKKAIQALETRSPPETTIESSASDSDSEKKTDQVEITESLRRRMAHLATLAANANAVGRRRFHIMQRAKES